MVTDVALREPNDFIELSRSHLLCVVFPKSRSPYYPHAVDLAAQAKIYRVLEGLVGPVHACAFDKGSESAARAEQLLVWVNGWSGVQVFIKGRATRHFDEVLQTLSCYQRGLACVDAKAHCHMVSEDAFRSLQPKRHPLVFRVAMFGDSPVSVPGDRLLIPCARVMPYFRVEPMHPSKWEDQFQAATVHHDTDWCPLLDVSAFGTIDPDKQA